MAAPDIGSSYKSADLNEAFFFNSRIMTKNVSFEQTRITTLRWREIIIKYSGTMTTDMESENKLIEYALSSEEYLDQFIPLIKAELLENESLDVLIESLKTISIEKDRDLQEISYSSMPEIVNSIDFVDNVVKNTNSMGVKIMEINKDLNKSGNALYEVRSNVIKYKQTRQRLDEANDKINKCSVVLNTTNKILQLIKTEDFYRSLILLQSLSNTYIQEIESFEFIKQIFSSIPVFKTKIITESLNHLNKWLNLSIKQNLTEIGEYLFDRFNSVSNNWDDKCIQDPTLINFKVNSPVEQAFRQEIIDPISHINIDLKDIYQSILVFKELNQLNELREYLNNDVNRRKEDVLNSFKHSLNKANCLSSNMSLRLQLFSIVGFSVIDKLINEKTNYQLRSFNDINNTLNLIAKTIYPFILNHIDYHGDNLNSLIELKDLIGSYYQILLNYNFSCNTIYKLLIKIFHKYIELSISNFKLEYDKHVANDKAEPFKIHNIEELRATSNNVFYMFRVENPKFPMEVPFSEIYVETSKLLKKFITNIYEFISVYYISDSILVNTISTSIDKVLNEIILKDLESNIESTMKEIFSQNFIHLDFYLSTIYEIENLVNLSDEMIIKRSRNFSSLIKLKSVNNFKTIKEKAFKELFISFDMGIQELLDSIDFEWDTDFFNPHPNTNLVDLIEFLRVLLESKFSQFPYSIKTLLLIKSLDKILKFLNDSILAAPLLTQESIKNFQINLEYIENGVLQSHIKGMDFDATFIESIKTMFIKGKQIVKLLGESNLENYKIDDIRSRQFNNISPSEALNLIDKLPKKILVDINGNEIDELAGEVTATDETFENSGVMENSQDDMKSILSSFRFRK